MRLQPIILLPMAFSLGIGFGCQKFRHKWEADVVLEPAETLPEWAYDAPFYFRPPAEALPKQANERDRDFPRHYYVRDPVILIDRRENNVPDDRVPRMCVWWTDTNGCLWNRGGFFGVGQAIFPLVTGDDGDYGIRFTGPGVRESLTEKTIPHRIYHLDRVPPYVMTFVEPDKPLYCVGEVVNVHWCAVDRWLDEITPARMAICWSWENPDLLVWHQGRTEPGERARDEKGEQYASRIWQPLEPKLDAEGVIEFVIPDFAVGEAFQFQVRAKDRAGNYGAGYSKVIRVEGASLPPEPDALIQNAATTQPAGMPVQPVMPWPAVQAMPWTGSQESTDTQVTSIPTLSK